MNEETIEVEMAIVRGTNWLELSLNHRLFSVLLNNIKYKFFKYYLVDEIIQYMHFGLPEHQCPKCDAKMWYSERLQKEYNARKLKFGMCCRQGR